MMLVRLCFAAAVATLAIPPACGASPYEVLYSFTGGSDGANPTGGVTADKKGNLYGATLTTIYAITPQGGERAIYTFSGRKDAYRVDPPLILRAQRLYGAAFQGGRYGDGTLFKIDPDGAEHRLYSFCSEVNCADGQYPSALITNGDGSFVGTTSYGGSHASQNHGGVIFRLAGRTETVLYSFCALANCTDGNVPDGIMQATDGSFYGATAGGGLNGADCVDGCGTIFRFTPDGTLTTLYSFCSQPNCSDGFSPGAAPIMDDSGTLYGTASFGGAKGCQVGCGVIYKLTPNGAYTVLHNFQGGKHGQWPVGALTMDDEGNLYGAAGGNAGSIFELTAAGVEKTLYAFCQSGCSDGSTPTGTLLLRNGYLYGTTSGGGKTACAGGCGVVFRLKAG